MTKQKTEQEIMNEVFSSFLKQVKGEHLSPNDKVNIEAWQLMKNCLAKQEAHEIADRVGAVHFYAVYNEIGTYTIMMPQEY